MRELVRVLNDPGTPAGIFTREAFGADGGMSPAAAEELIAETRERTRGVDVIEITVGHVEAVGQLRSRLTEVPMAFRVRLEPAPPHRILNVEPVRPDTLPPDPPPPNDAALVNEVDRYVRRLADADAFSGVVLIAKEGQPVLIRACGEANKDFSIPIRAETRFNLGSITKMFTAVAVLQLAERGVLSLDDPVSKYLPDVPDAESARRITIRQLLTHTSGLGDHVNAMARDPFRTRYRTVDRMLDLVRGVPPMFEPGSRWRYSNSGYLVLGGIVQAASGTDYYDYVRDNVFRPAGMNDSDFPELDRVNRGFAAGYVREFAGGRPRWRNNQFDLFVRGGPEGGAYSTAGDLLRFDRALRGHRLLGRALTEAALSAKREFRSPGYGYGFEVEEGGRIVGHGGSFVGVHTKLDMYPVGDYTAVVLSNCAGGAAPVVWKIRRLILAAK